MGIVKNYDGSWTEWDSLVGVARGDRLLALAQRERAAGPGALQPLEQVLDDARGGAPDEVVIHHVGIRLEADAAAFEARARAAGQQRGRGQLEHRCGLPGREAPGDAGGNRGDERVDDVV